MTDSVELATNNRKTVLGASPGRDTTLLPPYGHANVNLELWIRARLGRFFTSIARAKRELINTWKSVFSEEPAPFVSCQQGLPWSDGADGPDSCQSKPDPPEPQGTAATRRFQMGHVGRQAHGCGAAVSNASETSEHNAPQRL